MTHRLQNTIALTTIVYTAWMSFGLAWRYNPGTLELLANVLVGVLYGGLFVFLSDPNRLSLSELALQIASSALLFALFALFSVRALDGRYIGEQALHGAGYGAVMWLLGNVTVGIQSGRAGDRALAVAMCVGGLLLAPVLAEWRLAGAVFGVVAVGARVLGGVTLTRLPLLRQGFAFGVLVGITAVVLPGVGYFAYGAF